MTTSSVEAVRKAPKHGRRTAYEAANWHIVRAGLVLASSGVPNDAPEMRVIAAALRAVNRAGGIEEPLRPVPPVPVRSEPRKEVQRVFPASEGSGPGRPGKVA